MLRRPFPDAPCVVGSRKLGCDLMVWQTDRHHQGGIYYQLSDIYLLSYVYLYTVFMKLSRSRSKGISCGLDMQDLKGD